MSRIRIQDLTSLKTLNRIRTNRDGSTHNVGVYYARVGTYKWMEDVVTDRFKARSRLGEIIINPMTRYSQVFESAPTGYEHVHYPVVPPIPAPDLWVKDHFDSLLNFRYGPMGYGVDVAKGLVSFIPLSEREDLVTLSATAALSNWKESSVQSLVFLAELQKTLRTLRNPFEALRREIDIGLKRGFTLGGGLRGASGQYLTWFYGLRTIMFDIEGAVEALDVSNKCSRQTARAKTSSTATDVRLNNMYSGGGTLANADCETTTTETYTVRAGLVGDFIMGTSYSQGFGYRLRDIPAALWELIPWSFVLDWAVNMGEFIGSLMADTSDSVKGQWITTVHETKIERVVKNVTKNPSSTTYVQTLTCQNERDSGTFTTVQRSPVNLAASSGVTIRTDLRRLPGYAALALVVQQLLKRK